MSPHWPYSDTGMIALVRGVIAASSSARIDVVGARVDVDEDRLRAGERDHFARRDEGERRSDHFVAAPDAVRHQRDQQRVGAARRADAMLDADVLGELALQLACLRRRE